MSQVRVQQVVPLIYKCKQHDNRDNAWSRWAEVLSLASDLAHHFSQSCRHRDFCFCFVVFGICS
uniref:Uncharacterized protein n=1 Tax=Mola mola TaxID=94237 RepID=A0A3Q3XAK0_MOLML